MNSNLIETIKNTPVLGIGAPEIKQLKDLCGGKGLAGSDIFVCEGLWASEKLAALKIKIKEIFFCGDYYSSGSCPSVEARRLAEILPLAEKTYSISAKACARVSDRDGADMCFITAEMPKRDIRNIPLADNMLIMILDGQEQPGNVGAILRSLDAAGGSFAIAVNLRTRITHPRLIRSSLGAAFTLPFFEMSMDEVTRYLGDNGFRIVLTDLSASKNFCEISAWGRVAVVAGNEHTGISPLWRELPNAEPVIIPMLGSVESLNVGFASTLVAYNIGLRQKGLMN